MDRRTPYTLSVLAPSTNGADDSRSAIQNKLKDFVLEFQLDNAFIYRYAARVPDIFQGGLGVKLTRKFPSLEINYAKMC